MWGYDHINIFAYLTLTVKYQKQKFDVEKSHFKRGKIIYSCVILSRCSPLFVYVIVAMADL
jgi:hypothetical protein